MFNRSIARRAGKWFLIAALMGFGLAAMAEPEPTLKQVYEAAQAGKLDQAQVMMQQVLVSHPNSAKAHFVQAELSARQGQLGRARESLDKAEKLAPGLPFAKPEAVQSLRAKLAAKSSLPVAASPAMKTLGTDAPAAPSPASSFPWGLALALGGGAIAFGLYTSRKKPAPAMEPQGGYASQGAMPSGLSGPQSFGMGGAAGMQPAYGQPASSGIAGKVVGGLATGLAVGAGVMAAQAIGKSLMGNDEHPAHRPDSAANNNYEPITNNDNLGGQNFGVNDAGSWDDGNAVASGGDGGDWDV